MNEWNDNNNNGWINNCENYNFRNWKLNLEIGNSNDYLEIGF